VNRYRDEDDLDDLGASGEREITLSTATILGIFFLLALICAVFFGFGYTLGRKSASPVASTSMIPPVSAATNATGSKPSPGSRASQPPSEDDISAPTPDRVVVKETPQQAPQSVSAGAATPPASPAPAIRPAALTTPAAPAGPSSIVQIAAVSHQEDANVLVNALKHRGYDVTVRQVPTDKLLHVQIGPFASKADALAMRQRLLADGYNAIVK
jgi:DedD protein